MSVRAGCAERKDCPGSEPHGASPLRTGGSRRRRCAAGSSATSGPDRSARPSTDGFPPNHRLGQHDACTARALHDRHARPRSCGLHDKVSAPSVGVSILPILTPVSNVFLPSSALGPFERLARVRTSCCRWGRRAEAARCVRRAARSVRTARSENRPNANHPASGGSGVLSVPPPVEAGYRSNAVGS